MSWQCPKCFEELGDLNVLCEYCKFKDKTIVYNPDKYYIHDITIAHICSERPQGASMTPQEQLFSELFNHEKLLVKDMDLLTLRAHREELAKIAFEARARLTANDEEEKSRKNVVAAGRPTGFARSVNTDEATTDAINTVKERQKKLTKAEKLQAGLEKLGISATDAAKILSAGAILGQIKDKKSKDILTGDSLHSPLGQENGFTLVKPQLEEPEVKVFNPFGKK